MDLHSGNLGIVWVDERWLRVCGYLRRVIEEVMSVVISWSSCSTCQRRGWTVSQRP